jgi:hypothetical protein
MLNKDICKNCINESASAGDDWVPWNGDDSIDWDDLVWEKGCVGCRTDEYNDDVIQDPVYKNSDESCPVWPIKKGIPPWCKYRLEQAVVEKTSM